MDINSIEDIFNSDDAGLLADIDPTLFNKNNSREKDASDKTKAIAGRFPCEDFESFKPVFDAISDAIENRMFDKINRVSAKNVSKGSVFVLNGLLCYVADVFDDPDRKESEYKKRLRLIFANGTESDMLLHSMTIIQYKYDNSYQIVIKDPQWLQSGFGDSDIGIGSQEGISNPNGVIYVAKMRVQPDEFAPYNNPHKIGFTIHTGHIRSKNSIKDTAFLCREVDIISEWEAHGMDPHKVESLLHAFFSERHININITGNDGKQYRATEWFDIPLQSIEKAVSLILQGKAKDYRINEITGEVVPKTNLHGT